MKTETTILHGMAALLDDLHSNKEISTQTLRNKIFEMQKHCVSKIKESEESIAEYEKLNKYLDTIYCLDNEFETI